MTSPTRDVFQLELEKRGVVQAVENPVTGGIEILGPNGTPVIVIGDAAPDNDDGRPDGTVYIQRSGA